MNFVEKAKSTASSHLEEFFSYEMEVLNYDKMISPEDRHRRFIEMVQRVKSEEVESEEVKNK